jgi:uroporphyrinogen-III decarboxylase
MNNLERLGKTLNWEPVDRILTYDLMDSEAVFETYGGFDESKSLTEAQLIEMNARALKNVGLDVTRSIRDPRRSWMFSKIENWVRFFGIRPDDWEVSQKGGTAWISRRPFTDLRGLEKHMPELPKFEEIEAWYKPRIRLIKEIFDQYDVAFIGSVEGPMSDSYTYADTELFMTAIYDAPEIVSRLLDCTALYSAHIARVFAENASAPLMFMGEDTACNTGPMFSPKFLRENALPRWRWIMDPVKARGCKFLFHTDGRYGDLLPLIFDELGADGLNPVERNGCNDIFDIRTRYPRKLLFGNVCCAVTLPLGNVYDVEDETLEIIERIGPEGGILIGSSSEVHDLVPLENTLTMYRTVHEFGTYPLDIERIRARRAAIREMLRTRNY